MVIMSIEIWWCSLLNLCMITAWSVDCCSFWEIWTAQDLSVGVGERAIFYVRVVEMSCPLMLSLPKCFVYAEIGVEKARNATAVMFGDKHELAKLTSKLPSIIFLNYWFWSGSELEDLFSGTPRFIMSLERGSGKRMVEVLHQAKIFSSLGKSVRVFWLWSKVSACAGCPIQVRLKAWWEKEGSTSTLIV